MKFESYSLYDPVRVTLAQGAFLTVWSGLGSWHDDLVLLGGLVPTYLCGDVMASRRLPRPVTLDTDLGIGLNASAGQYGSLLLDLQAQGFRLSKDEFGGPRFVKTAGDFDVLLDFLAERPGATHGTIVVESIPANIIPGVSRALATARKVQVSGVDLFGAAQDLTARVCEVGPFLAMKLRAFAHRQQPKDAFDILYTLLFYDKGTNAAVAAFAEEVHLHNPACPDAVRCLERNFSSEDSPAPVKAAHFVLGQASRYEADDLRIRRLQIQQDVVDAGELLTAALASSV